ncbi:MAG: 3,4-dihydroxy-2-butanone 4-phosphate synthase [Candidatus Magasanikbacteria bacterium GW2011_GWA2_56_11]|uniref:3,4-dihydroxy-2-butanone 4-phosphate synthase n=1 Tax=Candidatus Magasanikbacteria bacterium GW2011_GWA2_56_11 TaxID=1619044 RepID=A0A0G1YET2_9BACT|nr:MAG: 3,4-dihydroxy-2-butanone 4-phosphate synthase [Candidatus Magasanikbacteria bacterium GW2011_GWA2_56_11]
MSYTPIPDIISAIASGRMVIVFDDDPKRESEADLVVAASRVTPAAVSFLAHSGGGLVCVALEGRYLDALEIPPMTAAPDDPFGTAWMLSVDHRATTTGISAFDRTRTIQALIDPVSRPEDFTRPGHVFPLRTRPGGLADRLGHTEAGVALTRLAGLPEAAVICEIMGSDGVMLRGAALKDFARRHQIPACTIAGIAGYVAGGKDWLTSRV